MKILGKYKFLLHIELQHFLFWVLCVCMCANVCLCVHVCMRAHACVCMCMWRADKDIGFPFSINLQLIPLKQGFSLNWNSLFPLGCPSCEPSEPTHLSPAMPQVATPCHAGLTAICGHTQIYFLMYTGTQTQVLGLARQVLLSPEPSPQPWDFFLFFSLFFLPFFVFKYFINWNPADWRFKFLYTAALSWADKDGII